ncbi:hypothetical protein JQC92_16360 [Shewanella sp. 202IG2-18]|uniref:hypothetical protein n=1 Tax=Parashewanella hymeniacidonis TaxID=2807618 RepID=UPI0019618964|nr:hypothetical protein [Parashewanella hymeniacidonis]MBM7073588.1 hypothetical protein [Parashewanella hymeniacidonis]
MTFGINGETPLKVILASQNSGTLAVMNVNKREFEIVNTPLVNAYRETADDLVESGLLSKDSELMKSIEECEQDLKNGDYKEIDDVEKHVDELLKRED